MKRALRLALGIPALGALVVATALGVSALDRALSERMSALRAQGIAAVERLLDRRVSYGSISPSILRQIVIRDLAVRADDGREIAVVRTLRVRYSLLGLLLGRDAVGSVREIRIAGATIALDLEADRDLFDLVARFSAPGGAASGLPRVRVVGTGVDAKLSLPGGRITTTGLSFDAGGTGDRIEVSVRGGVAGRMNGGPWFASSLSARGSVTRGFTAADATVRLLSLDTWLASARPQTLQVAWGGGRLEVTKIEDRLPVDLVVLADFPAGEVTATLRAEGFRPDQLVRPAGGLAPYAKWLAAPLSGSASVAWRPAEGTVVYQGDLTVELADQLPFPDVRVVAVFDGDRNRIAFSSLSAASPEGMVDFVGDVLLANFWPEGILTVSDLAGLPVGQVDTTISLQRLEGRLAVEGRKVQVGQVGLERLSAMISPRPAGIAFDLSSSFVDAPAGNRLHAAGELLTTPPRRLSLSAELTGLPPDRLYHLAMGGVELPKAEAQINDLLARLTVDADVELSTDFDRLTVTSPRLTVSSRDDPQTSLTTGFALDRGNVALSGFTGTWKGLTVGGDASVKVAADGSARFNADARFKDIPYALTGTWSPRDGLFIEGSYGLSVALVTGARGSHTLHASAARLPVPTADRVWYPTFDAAGEVGANGGWQVAGSLLLPDIQGVPSGPAVLETAFEASPRRITLRRLRYTDGVAALEGGGTVDFRTPFDPFARGVLDSIAAEYRVELKAAGAAESWQVQGTAAAGALDARVSFTATPLKRLGQIALRGEVSGTATIVGPFASPEVSASLALGNGMLATDSIGASATVRVAGRRFEISNLAVSYLDHRLTRGAGSFDLGAGTIEASGRYQGTYFGDVVNVDAVLQATLGGAATGDGPFDAPIAGRLALASIRVAGTPVDPWELRLHTAGGLLYLDGGPGDSLHASIDRNNAWVLAAQAPLPVTGRAAGRLVGTRIEADAVVTSFEVSMISSLLKSDIVTFTSGNASGRLVVAGPFNDPDITGSLELVGGRMRLRYSPDEIGPVNTTFTFTGRAFSAGPATAPVGNASATAQVVFTLDHWVPTSFVLDVATARDSAIAVSGVFGRVIVDGRAAGEVHLGVSERRTEVSGKVMMNEARVTLGNWVDAPFVAEDPPTFVSMTASTGKRVEFFWPSETFPVVRTTAAPGGKLAITYRGDTGAYTVTGGADVHGGEIFFFDRSFVMKEGSIVFQEDQRSFDPRITARAEIREWDPAIGEEVKIWLDVDDTLNRFSPRFSSDPALPEPDIFALLGAPFTRQVEGQGLLSSAVMLSSDLLSRFGLLRPFEQRVRELLGLDMFSVRTQVIQNIVAEKVLGYQGLNPLDNTSLSLGKYLGDDLFLEMLVRLEAPRGSSGLLLPGHGLTSEFELNLEWDTPFFLLEWSFLPRNPDALFLTDNSLALKWRYTY